MWISTYLLIASSLIWTPTEMVKVNGFSDVQISPNGKEVVFVASQADLEKNAFVSQVYQENISSKELHKLIETENSTAQPRWSPDGEWIAYIAVEGGIKNLYLISSKGGNPTVIVKGKESVQTFAWSSDSKQIAFVMEEEIPGSESIIYNQVKKINRLWTITKEGGAPVALTSLDYYVRGAGDFGSNFAEFDWSNDGKWIVFAYTEGEGLQNFHLKGSLALIELATGKITPLTKHSDYEAFPRFSPDSQWIGHLTGRDPVGFTYDRYLAVRSINDTDYRMLAPTKNEGPYFAGVGFLGWDKEGKHLLFFEPNKTKFHLVKVPVDGSSCEEIPSGDSFIKDITISGDKSLIGFVSETAEIPPEVYVSPIDHFEPMCLTQLNAQFLSYPIPKTEVIHWQAKDGQEIEALLTYPVGYNPDNKYPLLLIIHGGPMGFHMESFIGNPYPCPFASFAESQYMLLRPNPRGSTGYGKAFRHAIINDFGGIDYEDLMSGVDYLIAEGKVDSEKMGVMGWSYGGYMTASIITQTNRFKAALAGAGPYNLISMLGTSDLPNIMSDYLGDIWTSLDTYQKCSPLYGVNNVNTPCLLQHGLSDKRVPPTQSIELYYALDKAGKNPKLILYPEMPHGFSKPKTEIDAMEANLNWFNSYLKN